MRTLGLVTVLILTSTVVFAQAAPAPPSAPAPQAQPAQAAPPATPAVPFKPPVPRNIRFELTITDAAVSAKPISKTVIVTVAEGSLGSVRSEATPPGSDPNIPAGFTLIDKDGKPQTVQTRRNLPLNFDVRSPRIYEDRGSEWIQVNVSVEYQPYLPEAKDPPATVRAGSTSVFENGRKTVMLQAADPLSDRRTTIEVTATVLK